MTTDLETQTAPAPDSSNWGIDPVPQRLRNLGTFDVAALWGNLGISLLLPIVAAFLVDGLSFWMSLLAIAVGVVIGNTMLGYAASIGARTGAPAMVLYRPSLGRQGSYLPTILNVAQNIGWGAFELLIIGTAAAAITERAFGVNARPWWTLAFGVAVTAMAVGGPVLVVRKWIGRYAVWLVIASSIYLTVYVLTSVPFERFTSGGGEGMPFWAGVDLVVAMPISWIPLAADFTRFAKSPRAAGVGTGIGYAIAHAWFYVLGVLLILSNVASDPLDPTGFVVAVMAVPAGLLALGILAVDESDEAFANIYSASVSVQNAFPKLSQRQLSIVIGAVCTALAITIPLVQYENFLLLIGAVFVPLFGVLAAHHAIVRRGYAPADIYGKVPAVHVWGLVSWFAGFAAYNWINPGTVSWWTSAMARVFGAKSSAPSWLSASLFAFAVSFVLQALQRAVRGRGSLRDADAEAR